MSRFMTKTEVAEYLGISKRTLDHIVEKGLLTPYKFDSGRGGKNVLARFDRAEVEAFIEQSRQATR